ncbi:polysaccharide deacetylase family protein [Candidatus Pelagibacter sp.]|nr:polysaccharide deacetylase family protein [Candidatus Pelagibacter sp.]
MKKTYKEINNFPHGIMFHNFHDNKKYKKGDGSLSKKDLTKIIRFIGRKNILDANDFLNNYKNNTLKNDNVCFTFDDGSKSQADIALPILKKFNIKAFFFIYSKSLEKKKVLSIETLKYFRINYFKNINSFYDNFFSLCKKDTFKKLKRKKLKQKQIKNKYPFYSDLDIKFRVIRDNILNEKQYIDIMKKMIRDKKLNLKKLSRNIFFNKGDLIKLSSEGHVIGLHSHSHPLDISKKSYKKQYEEYFKNKKILKKILNKQKNPLINTMSYPMGLYNKNSFKALNLLNINYGFISSTLKREKNKLTSKHNNLTIPREDCSNIIKKINEIQI